MAVLNNLIVHGRSRFLNGINTDSIHTNLIDADSGIFKTITTTTLDAGTITTDMLTAINARVSQTLTVDGTISTNKWEAANIANIGGNFYISPTGKADSGTITVTKTSTTTVNGVSVGVYTLVVGSASFGVTSTSSTIWGTSSKVIFTGSISYNGSKKYPLGTCNGTMTTVSTGTNILTGFTITGVNSSALDIFFKEVGVTSVSSTACSGYEMQISVYQSYYSSALHPIGILLTSYGKEKKQYIDIYGGANTLGDSDSGYADPAVRIGQLDGLPNIVDGSTAEATKPTGWGVYTNNGFFKGKIVSNAGVIANFTINGSKLYSNGHSAYNTATTGIYIGDDYISFGSGGVTYFNTSGTGKVGPWTLSTTYFRNGNIASATNTSVAGVYLGTDGLNISNGTAATTSYITKSAVNIGNKLTWNGTTLSVNGNITSTSGQIGPWFINANSISRNANGNAAGAYNTASNMYFGTSGLSLGTSFSVTSAGVLTATDAEISGNIAATTGSISGSVTIGGTKTATTILNDIVEAGTKASNFISADEFGIMIYDGSNGEQASSTISSGIRNILIDNNSINIRNGTTTLSYFGEEVRIGELNKASIRFSSDEIYASGNDGKEYFSFNGDGSDLAIPVNLVLEDNVYWRGYASSSSKTYVLDKAPVAGTSIYCSMQMSSPGMDSFHQVSFTAGTAGTKQVTFYYRTKTGAETTYIIYLTYDGNSTLSNLHTNADTPLMRLYLSVGYTSSVSTPVYSFGMDNIVTGAYATAIGRANESSGNYSFSEGYATHARGIYSHSEGTVNYSDGYASHTEGYANFASGYYSHSEGYDTTASGDNSHSEGSYTTASGDSSHSEGRYTTAFGNQSHASGDHTKANWCNSIVTGQYNIDDLQTDTFTGNGTQKAFALSSTIPSRAGGKLEDIMVKVNGVKVVFGNNQWNTNRYTSASITFGTAPANGASIEVAYPTSSSAFVIGNGNGISDDPNERSNALTVDWDGNITIQNHDTEIGHVYSASANVAISNTSIDANTGGASISLSAGTYIVIGQWHFNTRTTTGTTNSAIRLYRSGSGDNIAQTRIVAGANNWNCLQCMAIVELTGTETLKVCGATSRPYTTAQGTYITAVRIK